MKRKPKPRVWKAWGMFIDGDLWGCNWDEETARQRLTQYSEKGTVKPVTITLAKRKRKS